MKTTIAILLLSTGLLFAEPKTYQLNGTVQSIVTEGLVMKLNGSVRSIEEANTPDPFKDQIVLLVGYPLKPQAGAKIYFPVTFDMNNVQRIGGYAVMNWANPAAAKTETKPAASIINKAPVQQKAPVQAGAPVSYTAKVIAKTATGLTVVVSDSVGIQGIGAMNHSLINQGNTRLGDAVKTAEDGRRDMKNKEAMNTRYLTGYPTADRVMIGSTISFKGTPSSSKNPNISYVE